MTNQRIGWWEWLGWKGLEAPQPLVTTAESPTVTSHQSITPAPEVLNITEGNSKEDTWKTDGWNRLKDIYRNKNTMELDVITRVVRMSFFGGFLVGGTTGYARAKQAYETNNVGRQYLSPSDAVKRKIDYAIVRFAKGGFGVGFKCALISGSIVGLATHAAAYRDKFASWYFPAISGATSYLLHTALVGGVFTFPLGLLGSIKALGLGVSSGLTLSAVVHLYAMAIDKPVDEAYWSFKKDYEKELKSASDWDGRVKDLMERENITWRQTAVRRLKQIDQERMTIHDD